jgi:acetolactate synthase-1/2/3 large subunit
MKTRMSDYLIERMYDAGAKDVFFVPGTGCMFLTDALARKKELNAVSVHHEQAAGMAALTYAKCNETLGACIVTTGCGGTNAITAVLHAWQDNVPCVFISGQAARNQTVRNANVPLRQMGRQEADIVEIIRSIVKYAVMINSPEEIAYEIDKALFLATSGRKGPVWIDVPADIQNCLVETDELKRFDPSNDKSSRVFTQENKEYVQNKLKAVKRPVLLAGNGIRLSGAIPDFKKFVEKYRIPVVYSKLGHDLIETDNPLSIGMVGMLGASRAGNFALANSDLIISVGCRLSIDTTGYEYDKFAREADVIVVDIDEIEHKKNTVKIDHFIHSDAKSFFNRMNEESCSVFYNEWEEKCLYWKKTFPVCIGDATEGTRLNMYYFVELLSKYLPVNATILSDAGNTFFIVPPAIKIKEGQRSITSGGQAEMGYALPGAIGAAFARKGQVVAICGDGSVMMNLQELETLAFLQLPVKLCIMNNNGYSSIRNLQDNVFRGRQIGCDPTSGISFPDFEKVAGAFGLNYMRLDTTGNVEDMMVKMFADDKPWICEVMCVEKQQFLNVSMALNSKKRMVTRPLEDQAPFIARELLQREMIISPLD